MAFSWLAERAWPGVARAVAVTALGTTLAATVPQAAGAANLGFENGDLTDWTTDGPNTGAITVFNGSEFGEILPIEGTYFAGVEAGSQDVYSLLWQDVTAQAGQVISGWFNFYNGESDFESFFNDDGYVSVNGTVLEAESTGGTLGGPNGWVPWEFLAMTDGTYRVEVGVRNVNDNIAPSYAFLDGVAVSDVTDTPEPASMAVLGLALAGLAGARRRRR